MDCTCTKLAYTPAPAGTILGEFGRGESIPLVGDGRRLDSNSNADNV